MAQLYFKVGADYQNVIKLREEIQKLEAVLKGFSTNTPVVEIRRVEQQLASAKNKLRETTKEASEAGASLKDTFSELGKPLAMIGGVVAIKEFLGQVVRIRGEFQEMETSIETLVGTQMKNKLIPQIKELAKVSPLTMQDIVGAEKMMLGFNIEADKTIGFLKALSDVAMGSSAKFNSLTLAFSQMSASGKLMGQDLNQMINSGFNPLQQISISTGKSIATLKEEMSKGAISAEMVQQAFIDATSAGGKFYKMSENASKTINGQLSMLEDAMDSAFNEIGTKSESLIMGAIQSVTGLIENYETIGRVLASLIATYGAYKTAVLVATAVDTARLTVVRATALGVKTNTAGVIAHTIATKAATIAQATFNKVANMNPYVLLASAVVAVGTALWAFADRTTTAEKAEKALSDRLEANNKFFDDRKGKIDSLIQSASDEYEAETKRQESLEELKKLMPSVFDQFSTYIDLTNQKTEAQKTFNEELAKERQLQETKDYQSDLDILKKLDRMQDIRAEWFKKHGTYAGFHSEQLNPMIGEYMKIKKSIPNFAENINITREIYAQKVNAQAQGMRDKAQAEYSASISKKTKEELQKDIEEYNKLIKFASDKGVKYVQMSGDNFATSIEDLKKRVQQANERITLIDKNATIDFKAQAIKQLKDAQAELKKVEANMNNRSIYADENAYQKAHKEASQKVESAKKKLKTDYNYDPEKEKADLKKISDTRLKLESDNEDARIKLIKDKREQLLAEIKKDWEDRKREIQKQENEFKELNKKAKKDETLTAEQQTAIDKAYELNDQEKSRRERDEVYKQDAISLREYNREYGTIQEQRLAIVEEYEEKINQAISEGEKKRLKKQRDNELLQFDKEHNYYDEYIRQYGSYLEKKELLEREHKDALRKIAELGGDANAEKLENANFEQRLQELKQEFGLVSSSMADLFEDASKKTVKDIQKIINKYKELIDILKAKEGTPITKDDLANIGLTQQQVQDVVSGKVSIKELTDALKMLEDELESKSPFQSFVADIKGAVEGLKEANGETDKIGNAIANIGSSVTSFAPALGEFASSIASIFGQDDAEIQDIVGAVGGLGETASGIGQMLSGDIVGGIMSAVKGIANVVNSIKSLSDRDNESRIKKLQEQVEELSETYDELSDKISKAYSHDAQKLIEDQNKLLQQQRVLVEQQLKEEESKKNTDKDRIKEYEAELKRIDDTLEENKEKAIDVIFGEDLQSAIENFASAYANAISSGDKAWKSSKDYAREMMRQMVINSINSAISSSKAIEQIREKLDEFYKDGILSATEQSWVYEATEEAMEDINKRFGWADELLGDHYSQNATSEGLQSLTQEQGEKLEGRFTALQLAGERISDENVLQTQELTLLNATTADLLRISQGTNNALNGIADQIAMSYLELQEINENGANTVKYLKDIKADIAEVKNNTSNLV